MANVTVYVMTVWHNLPTKDSAIDATNLNHLEQGIKNVTDFVNTINASSGLYLCQTPFTNALKNKLDGIEAEANKYVLPKATTSALGGVIVDGTTITVDANGKITSRGGALSTLTDINLTDLADGQILKYDATTEKWINTSEAEVRTQLSLLEDVDIDDQTLADGDALRYNGTTEKWENGPAGDVLDYDETLEVLGDPAEEFETNHRTLLWGDPTITYPATQPADVELSHDIKDYDEIAIITGWLDTGVECIEEWHVNAQLLDSLSTATTQNSKQFVFPCNAAAGNSGQWIRMSKGSADNIIHFIYNSTPGVYQIYGIKY